MIGQECCSLGKVFWAVKASPRVSFFIWTAAWEKILTCDNLIWKGYTLVGWCCMCRSNGETVDHLLLHCPAAYELWIFIFRLFHTQWVMPQRVLDLLFGWHNWFGKHYSDI
jgi:hypothetical protein